MIMTSFVTLYTKILCFYKEVIYAKLCVFFFQNYLDVVVWFRMGP